MTEPRRLLDDPEMGALLRADLDAAKNANVDYDVDRGMDRHMALVGAGVIGIVGGTAAQSSSSLASAAGGAASSASTAATGGVMSAVKAAIVAKGIWVAAGVGVATAVGATTSYVTHSGPWTGDDPKPALVAPQQNPANTVTKAPAAGTNPASTGAEEVTSDEETVDPSTLPLTHESLTQPKAAAKPTAAKKNLDAEEAATYASARSLATQDPTGALAILQKGEPRFQGGILSQEREALAIQCLSRLGRDSEAKTRADAFLKAYPASPLAESVRRNAKLD